MKAVVDIISGITFLAIVAVLVKSANTAKIAAALGTDFNGSLSTAEKG